MSSDHDACRSPLFVKEGKGELELYDAEVSLFREPFKSARVLCVEFLERILQLLRSLPFFKRRGDNVFLHLLLCYYFEREKNRGNSSIGAECLRAMVSAFNRRIPLSFDSQISSGYCTVTRTLCDAETLEASAIGLSLKTK